ncbi:Cysteinyl-tRNA synthetase [Klebsormidium nitens]|uniref:cysteine--tRNA ligase n=1 Tax=Klebsormidium nitens TaxID=105231 RepID=A0A1Y1I5L6_KLENI|nr:Cysteinyl-tRNA synthetase [Klebsormidium nitens]|eukprot:GAQ85783.1 Cysteinyl-tRNA synthetase [Klebsormidium nitens]
MAEPVANGELPRWTKLAGMELSKPRVNNSLTNEKTVLEGSGPKGRRLTWYNCGPTVYDAAHVGHARNYLTFDIIRRILEDYFGYSIFYVMNVTDVDDKIILKARQNFLVEEYKATAKDPNQVLECIREALKTIIPKQESKVRELSKKIDLLTRTTPSAPPIDEPHIEKVGPGECEEPTKVPSTSSVAKQLKELETAVTQEELKLSNHIKLREKVEGAAEAALADGAEGAARLIDVGRDALALALDAAIGINVQDQMIFRSHAAKYEAEFFEDMERLGWRKPRVVTRVTDYMSEVVAYVAKIVDRGLAYEANGSIYFDTVAFREAGHRYGKLCPWAVGTAELAAESEANFATSEKKSPNDFALWKASKGGEPFWPSPWGQGRPGWHIECSAMASDVIGDTVDIHTGGFDLKFPHHENELAQAEAHFGCHQWVNYFLHSGHLHIEGLKMSKSLKNFVTIRKALEQYSARQLRLLFVLSQWDKPMNYGDDAMRDALSKERDLRTFFQNVQVALREVPPPAEADQRWGADEKEMQTSIEEAEDEVRARLEDNFDTPGAMSALDKLMSAVNKYLRKAQPGKVRAFLLKDAALLVERILYVFGLTTDQESLSLDSEAAGAGASKEQLLEPYLNAFAAFRDDIRSAAREGKSKETILQACDQVRDETMVDLGVRLEDRVDAPSVWKLDDPETMRKERDAKKEAADAAAKQKLERKRDSKKKDIEKWTKASVPPEGLFRNARDAQGQPKYSAFNDEGVPTHDAAGKELSTSARKGAEKDMSKARRGFQEYEKKEKEQPGFLAALQEEVKELIDQIQKLSR